MAEETKFDVYTEGGKVIKVLMNGEELLEIGDNIFVVPKNYFKDVKLKDLPQGVIFEICESIDEGGIIHISGVNIFVSKIDTQKAFVEFEDWGRRKYWDGNVGFKLYMETKRDIIKEREKELKDIKFASYDDDGDYIFLRYSAEISSELVSTVIVMAEQLESEIVGAVDLALGSPFKMPEQAKDEKDFSISVVIPLLRKLGFSDVRYNHGKREFGKDITFSKKIEFDEYEFFGAQVKHGNISGGAGSEIDDIISQLDDAFKMPFYNVYSRRKEYISKLVIIISGKFTENAIMKICGKIEIPAIKNNVIFIDGEKIKTLSERFRKKL